VDRCCRAGTEARAVGSWRPMKGKGGASAKGKQAVGERLSPAMLQGQRIGTAGGSLGLECRLGHGGGLGRAARS
jgi:hypothetical protein